MRGVEGLRARSRGASKLQHDDRFAAARRIGGFRTSMPQDAEAGGPRESEAGHRAAEQEQLLSTVSIITLSDILAPFAGPGPAPKHREDACPGIENRQKSYMPGGPQWLRPRWPP